MTPQKPVTENVPQGATVGPLGVPVEPVDCVG